MQQLDARYAFILLPILYAIIPFILTGNFLLLGAISVGLFIVGGATFVIIFSLNIGGSGQVVASGVSGRLGLNTEGTYMLFVLVFGGLFYGITTFVVTFMDNFINVWNVVFGWLGLTISIDTSNINEATYVIASPSSIYPSDFTIQGIAPFPLLTILMGLIYIIGIFFLISSRGR